MNKVLENSLRILKCPICGGELRLRYNKLKCVRRDRSYLIRDGIIDLLPRSLVFGNDPKWMKFYDE